MSGRTEGHAAPYHGSWVWSVLRGAGAPSARVDFRSAEVSAQAMLPIVDNAIRAGRGASLELTFWDTPDHEVATVAPMLLVVARSGVALEVIRRCADPTNAGAHRHRTHPVRVGGFDADPMRAVIE